MSDAVVVAAIGAAATVATAIISAVASIISKKKSASRPARTPSYKVEAIIIAAALLVAAAIVAYGRSRPEKASPIAPPGPKTIVNVIEPAEFQRLIDAAKAQQKPYVVDSIVMYVRLEDELHAKPKRRRAYVRAIYNVRALKDFTEADDTFVEQFTSSIKNAPALHWFGNRPEILHNDDGSIYSVKIGARDGDRFTIITGVTFEYKLPYPANRTAPSEVAKLGPNEDYWVYPNREDFVGELTIILESPTTILLARDRGAIRVTNNQPNLADVFVGQRVGATASQRSLSHTWYYVKPGERVGIFYWW